MRPLLCQCDACGKLVEIPAGWTLPANWERDEYTGQDRCPDCVRLLKEARK